MQISDLYSFRFAEEILGSVGPLHSLWEEIVSSIESISDEELKNRHIDIQSEENTKSLSKAINQLLDERLRAHGWRDQSGIFAISEYEDEISSTWTLDFSKSTKLSNGELSGIAIEVAFNHSEAAAWNLTKPMLAAEINDVRVQTNIGEGVGVVIVASSELKKNGAFDGAIGDFNRYAKTLRAMRNVLTVPILLVGLAAPTTFKVQARPQKDSPYKSGQVVPISV
jgi:hypothetical protein